jgi:hypothetical protein
MASMLLDEGAEYGRIRDAVGTAYQAGYEAVRSFYLLRSTVR